ncbi:hypothetical protein Tco_0784974 [Tanacetum coccineum]
MLSHQVIPFFKTLKEHFEGIQKALTKEIKEIKDIFEELEAKVDQNVVNRKHDEIEQKNIFIANDNLIVDWLVKGKWSIAKSQNNVRGKASPCSKLEYEMWEIRIKQYFQIQDYALWEVIENGNSWVPIPVTATETGPSTGLKMIVPSTAEEKICKKNDVKARSLLLMALPNEHQLTFNQYVDAQSMFAAIKARFRGNEATKRTQKALLKQQYENFNASSSESLDSIFNRLQKLVSRLAILGVVTPPEDLNVKFLRSLPSEWDTHVVVWMNKPDFDTMGLDDLYNNFKIVEQKVKRSTGAINDEKNLAFLTTSGASSTKNINTVNPEVSTGTTKVNTASTEISTASFSDATVYAFLSTQPQGSQLTTRECQRHQDVKTTENGIKEAQSSAVRQTWLSKGISDSEYGPRDSSVKTTTGCEKESDNSKENTDDFLKQQQKTNSSSVKSPLKIMRDEVEPILKVEKKIVIPTATKKEFVKPETPVRRSVSCPNVYKHMVPRAILMKTGLKIVNIARSVNTVSCSTRLAMYSIGLNDSKPHNKTSVMNIFRGIQGVSESSTSSQQDQDNHYYAIADSPIQEQNGLHDRVMMIKKILKDDSSHQNKLTPEDLGEPSPTIEDTIEWRIKKLNWGTFLNLMKSPQLLT